MIPECSRENLIALHCLATRMGSGAMDWLSAVLVPWESLH